MPLPVPEPGLVIRYSFLWSEDHASGHEEGDKDGRPVIVVAAVRDDETGIVRVSVLPITHTPPVSAGASVEIPHAIKAHVGLDASRSWVRLDEINRFDWPGFDLRQLPGKGEFAYGFVSRRFYAQVIEALKERRALGRVMVTIRD